MSGPIRVAAGAIINRAGEVLIARRPDHLHQGGLWEFPGGKVEAGETVVAALARELHEELGITLVPSAIRPLIRIPHAYPDRVVLLDVWRVEAFTGQPHGREGQPICWVLPDALPRYAFPAANLPIVTALRLPTRYLITPDPQGHREGFLAALDRALAAGLRLVQLRAKSLAPAEYRCLAEQVVARCRANGARLLLNAEPGLVPEVGADGVHLTSRRLMELTARPLPPDRLVAASCHDRHELDRARALGVDFAVVSPVAGTATHPQVAPLGFTGLQRLTEHAPFPVYALGGMGDADLVASHRHGAQGIAAIRGLWPG